MTTYDLYNDETNEIEEFVIAKDSDAAYERALFQLSARVEPKTSDTNVRDYFVISDCGDQLFKFSEYMYERACIEALSLLGYSLFENSEQNLVV
jgi:hypothetical protein